MLLQDAHGGRLGDEGLPEALGFGTVESLEKCGLGLPRLAFGSEHRCSAEQALNGGAQLLRVLPGRRAHGGSSDVARGELELDDRWQQAWRVGSGLDQVPSLAELANGDEELQLLGASELDEQGRFEGDGHRGMHLVQRAAWPDRGGAMFGLQQLLQAAQGRSTRASDPCFGLM